MKVFGIKIGVIGSILLLLSSPSFATEQKNPSHLYIDLAKYSIEPTTYPIEKEIHISSDIANININALDNLDLQNPTAKQRKLMIYADQNKNFKRLLILYIQRIKGFGKQDKVKNVADAINVELVFNPYNIVITPQSYNKMQAIYLKNRLTPQEFEKVRLWSIQPISSNENLTTIASILGISAE